jgi:tetratricopeptide (TPR) repeat protein
LGQAAARLPYDGYIVYRAGLADLAAQRYASAARRLQQAAGLTGWSPALRAALGDAYFGQGDHAGAVAQWEQALADLPDAAGRDTLLMRLAEVHEAAGRYADAIDALARRLEGGAAEPVFLYRLALLTAATTPADAVARLTTVTVLPSEFAAPADRLLRAVQAGLDQGDPAYLYGRVGYELIQLQEWPLAEYALSQAVALNPDYADAYAYLGLAQDSQGKDGTAAFQKAVALAPTSALAQYLLGLHYRRLGQSAQALPYLQAAQKLDPSNPALLAEIGGAYAAQNDLMNAENAFTEAVRLAPKDPQFWLLLARFHVDNEWKVAELGLPAARMAVGLNPESAPAHDALGYALVVSGDLVNGRESLERALQLDPNLAAAHYHLGLYSAIQNNAAEARAALERALALDPEGPYGNLALKALALLP